MQIIPFKENPQFREEVDLDGTRYILIFDWNAINEYWAMSIYDDDFTPIAVGLKVVTQWNLTEQIVQTGMPLGDILCQNITGGFEKIKRDDMGQTSELIYYAEGELSA